ncbi:MAG: TIGR00730 family Rossman fold protein [Planctomycetes bacterium]|nr:TIGR00730 family Rossman fold protein [Planctomycetota bacterium]
MMPQDTTPETMSDAVPSRADAIRQFVKTFCSGSDEGIYSEMLVSVCRLAKDGCGRGELKILNRTLKELRYAFKVFDRWRDIYKVSIFGSSRTAEDHPQYRQAVKFAQLIEKLGWMVITGAGDGIMRAGNDGATRDASFGVAISLPFEQSTNTIIADDEKLINFKYFFTRKLIFVKEAHAIVLFPGGFGTQDEGFEALTLIQTGKANPMPVVMVDEPGGTYWQHWCDYTKSELLGAGMISPEDMNLFYVTDSIEAAVREVVHFYHRYHSSRFVRDELVLRLKRPLNEAAVEHLNDEFADILVDGRIVQRPDALPAEQGEYPGLPRLVLHYDRRSPGRLRLLINAVNDVE